jgi:putative ABC transport system ATP-binding protein
MVCLENVVKIYRTPRGMIKALDDINLCVEKGEFVVIRGPSGCGKTTLLMTIAGMQCPTSGSVSVNQYSLYEMSRRARANFRAASIGFVFQMFYLVPYLNVIENVILAARAIGKSSGTVEAGELLKQLDLVERAFHKPAELSTGEKQRTAIARALFNNPEIILVDEPTGNLDLANAAVVLGYLAGFHSRGGTVIVVTHQAAADKFADRVINMRNGRIDNSV